MCFWYGWRMFFPLQTYKYNVKQECIQFKIISDFDMKEDVRFQNVKQ